MMGLAPDEGAVRKASARDAPLGLGGQATRAGM